TRYRVLERYRGATLLELALVTGRRGQIRAQLAALGHPIVGDRTYGSRRDPLRRVCLHAARLGFVHPSGRRVVFESPPPSSFRRTAEKPKPCTRPNRKLTTQRRGTAGRGDRLSAATRAIERAITASTRRSGSTTTSSTASASVTLWATVNAVMILNRESIRPPRRISPSRNSRWS